MCTLAHMFALEPLGQTRTEADQTQDAKDAQVESGALHLPDQVLDYDLTDASSLIP